MAEAIRTIVAGKFHHSVLDTGVLPNDGVVNGDTGFAIPDDGGLTLVGDTDGSDVFRANPALLHRLSHHFVNAPPDFFGIVFHPAGFRINLLVFLLRNGNDSSGRVEDDEASAGGSLIDCA